MADPAKCPVRVVTGKKKEKEITTKLENRNIYRHLKDKGTPLIWMEERNKNGGRGEEKHRRTTDGNKDITIVTILICGSPNRHFCISQLIISRVGDFSFLQ